MQSRDYGVMFTETGYRFYVFDYQAARMGRCRRPIACSSSTRCGRSSSMALVLDGRDVPLDARLRVARHREPRAAGHAALERRGHAVHDRDAARRHRRPLRARRRARRQARRRARKVTTNVMLRSARPASRCIEVMVALVIVALGMMAVNTQLNRYTVAATYVETEDARELDRDQQADRAQHRADLAVASATPKRTSNSRDNSGAAQIEVAETPVPNLHRVDVSVALRSDPERVVHKVSALIEPPAPAGFPARRSGPRRRRGAAGDAENADEAREPRLHADRVAGRDRHPRDHRRDGVRRAEPGHRAAGSWRGSARSAGRRFSSRCG